MSHKRTTAGTDQHRIPAAIIGRFGRRKPGKPRREAAVRVTSLADGSSRTTKAEKLAFDFAAYDYTDGRSLDDRWDGTEQRLADAIALFEKLDLAAPVLSGEHLTAGRILNDYVIEMLVRSRNFDLQASHHGLDRDQTQDRRAETLDELRRDLAAGTHDLLVLVRRSERAGRLVLNDLGYVQLAHAEHGYLAPLGANIAVFLSTRRRHPDPSLEVGELDSYIPETRRAAVHAQGDRAELHPAELYSHPDDDLRDVLEPGSR